MGDEHWLYFSGVPISHGFYLDESWQRIDRWTEWTTRHGKGGIGFARWPKYRLFGFESDPSGHFTIDLGVIEQPSELYLNYKTKADGAVRVELCDGTGKSSDECVPLTGDSVNAKVAWKNGTVIEPSSGRRVLAVVHLDVAGVYAYEVLPVR